MGSFKFHSSMTDTFQPSKCQVASMPSCLARRPQHHSIRSRTFYPTTSITTPLSLVRMFINAPCFTLQNFLSNIIGAKKYFKCSYICTSMKEYIMSCYTLISSCKQSIPRMSKLTSKTRSQCFTRALYLLNARREGAQDTVFFQHFPSRRYG